MFEDHEPARRPHIVLISVDMVPPDFHRAGETNSGLARTPNIARLRADPRWRCYWHTLQIDKAAELPPEEGNPTLPQVANLREGS